MCQYIGIASTLLCLSVCIYAMRLHKQIDFTQYQNDIMREAIHMVAHGRATASVVNGDIVIKENT